MSDSTKKSIVINQSFLSNSGSSSGAGNQNKKSKKLRTRLTDESIIKPNKLKRMLLDKINAKRKAEYNSPVLENNINNQKVDVSKESKIFSNEFKKSLEFLDNYVNTKQLDKNKNRTKTLKKQNAASLSNDIIKTLHSNNSSNVPSLNIRSLSPSPVSLPIQQPIHQPTSPVTPLFQKIQLQLPQKPTTQVPFQVIPSSIPTPKSTALSNTLPKINLALGKNVNVDGGNLIYTELPPELQPGAPSTMMFAPSTTSPTSFTAPVVQPIIPAPITSVSPIPVQESMNTELINMVDTFQSGEAGEMNKINNDIFGTDSLPGKTSLATSTSTFSPIKLFDDKPYGCLKDGKKPTYRAYNKTIKNNLRFSDSDDTNSQSERQQKLQELKNRHRQKKSKRYNDNDQSDDDNSIDYYSDGSNINNGSEQNDILSSDNNKKNKSTRTSIKRQLRKTITKKFKLGKQGNSVGVLIKNNETRKNIQKEHGILKNKKLSEVKKYLVEHNLIKIGSTAPPSIIRKIYEDSILTGEVENIGKGVSLHNFLEEENPW